MVGQLECIVWGEEIYIDPNGVSVTHELFVDPNKSDQEPTHSSAGHCYDVIFGDRITEIHFQHGPIHENGLNGITSEALLSILIHRTKVLESKLPCTENEQAILLMENALTLIEQRIQDH